MRIGDVNQGNYARLMKMFSSLGGRGGKMPMAKLPDALNGVKDPSFNPYAKPGQDITNRTDWKKIIPVSDEVEKELRALVKESYTERYGMSGEGDQKATLINNYLQTLPPEDRSPASWTLNQIRLDEAERLASVVRDHNPGWQPGQPFDTSIFNESPPGNDFYIKI